MITCVFDLICKKEIIRVIFNISDILGVHLVLNSFGSSYDPEIKILGVGVGNKTQKPCILTYSKGWAFADSLFIRLPQYWFGARTLEFDWTYIQSALEGNIYLVNLKSHLPHISSAQHFGLHYRCLLLWSS